MKFLIVSILLAAFVSGQNTKKSTRCSLKCKQDKILNPVKCLCVEPVMCPMDICPNGKGRNMWDCSCDPPKPKTTPKFQMPKTNVTISPPNTGKTYTAE